MGYTAKVNPAELGYHIKAFINLEVNPDQKKEFYPYIKKCNNVVECNCVTGEYAMLIEVMFKVPRNWITLSVTFRPLAVQRHRLFSPLPWNTGAYLCQKMKFNNSGMGSNIFSSHSVFLFHI